MYEINDAIHKKYFFARIFFAGIKLFVRHSNGHVYIFLSLDLSSSNKNIKYGLLKMCFNTIWVLPKMFGMKFWKWLNLPTIIHGKNPLEQPCFSFFFFCWSMVNILQHMWTWRSTALKSWLRKTSPCLWTCYLWGNPTMAKV